MTKGIFTILLLFISLAPANAQGWRIRQAYRANPPKAILVQLFTYPRRVEFFKKTGHTGALSAFKDASADAAKKIVEDFNDNFDFCPVYYYYDTNAHLVREHKFSGVLLNAAMLPAKNVIIDKADTSYFIIVNSLLISEDFLPGGKQYAEDESVFNANDNVNYSKARLIVLDHKFRQLPRQIVRTPHGNVKPEKGTRHYKYSNSNHNLYYSGKAATLNENFKEFYHPGF
jgi:hypothetical protein